MIKLADLIRENQEKSQGFLNIINNQNFKKWFGYSKVVDNKGNPMVVFHGTKSPVKQFSKKRTGVGSTILGNYEVERYGIFAAEDPKLAHEYVVAGDYPHEETFDHSIMPLFMKIESPLDTIKSYYTDALFNTIEEWGTNHKLNGYWLARDLGNKWGRGTIWTLFDKDEQNDPEIWIKMFENLGYDGLRIYDRSEESSNNVWVAFEPEQVKSAIGNQGAFGSDVDILKN